jgi:hypothetical protein
MADGFFSWPWLGAEFVVSTDKMPRQNARHFSTQDSQIIADQ